MQKYCLMITQSKDKTADYLAEKMGSHTKVSRINVDQLQSYELSFTNEGFTMYNPEENHQLQTADIFSVYYRKIAFPDLSMYEHQYHSLMQKEIMSLIEGIAETVGERC